MKTSMVTKIRYSLETLTTHETLAAYKRARQAFETTKTPPKATLTYDEGDGTFLFTIYTQGDSIREVARDLETTTDLVENVMKKTETKYKLLTFNQQPVDHC